LVGAWLCYAAGNPDISLTFKVTKEGTELVEPRLPRLAGIRGRSFAASVLLFEMTQRGLYLTPQARDAGPADLALKVGWIVESHLHAVDQSAAQSSRTVWQLRSCPMSLFFSHLVLMGVFWIMSFEQSDQALHY